MGCIHSTAREHDIVKHHRGGRAHQVDRVFHKDVGNSVVRNKDVSLAASPCVSPSEALNLSKTVVTQHSFSGVDHIMLATIALIESGGNTAKQSEREDIGECVHGICQMLLSTARWLAMEKGYTAHGSPCQNDLLDPLKCLYFCAAYLQLLSSYGGQEQSREYVVKAYHSGPKGIDSSAARLYWEKFVKGRGLLQQLQEALDEAQELAEGGQQQMMHVVQPGEGLARIATVCSVSVEDILSANPDISSPSDIHPHDCIALPVSQILPSIYIVQPGDSLSSIATAHRTTPSRILASNPECQDLSKVQPGWPLALPGLKGGAGDVAPVSERRPYHLGGNLHRHPASLENMLDSLEADTSPRSSPLIVPLY